MVVLPGEQNSILHLVGPRVSADTVQALEELLAAARTGAVVGVAFVAMHSTSDYTTDIAGECCRSRVLTRGMVLDLLEILPTKA